MQHQSYSQPFVLKQFRCWEPLLPDSLRDESLEIVRWVATRMLDPDNLVSLAKQALKQSSIPGEWRDSSLSYGFASASFAFSYICQALQEPSYIKAAQHFFALAVRGTQKYPLTTPAFFDGTCGLSTTLTQMSHVDARYLDIKKTLDRDLCEQVLSVSYVCDEQRGVAASEYDVVSGASGTLAYLLTIPDQDDLTHQAIVKLVNYLIWLAKASNDGQRYHWFIPPTLLSTENKRREYPQGMYDCGLAHGIAGPLAALACARLSKSRDDIHTPQLDEAIQTFASWLIAQQTPDEWGVNWPAALHPDGTATQIRSATRAAWCYGAPGISRALWLAGKALSDITWQSFAIEAIEATLRRPIEKTWINSPTFCHGWAGLLQICLRFAHEVESSLIHESIPFLTRRILDTFSPDNALGFRDREVQNLEVDQISWLTGAPGVVMTLLAAATAVEPSWDHALLIS